MTEVTVDCDGMCFRRRAQLRIRKVFYDHTVSTKACLR